MRTELIEDMPPSRFDTDLLRDLELIGPPPDAAANGAYIIGIRDERGDIYRLIRVKGRRNAAYLLGKLRSLGYLNESPNSYESELGYDMIVDVVKVAIRRR